MMQWVEQIEQQAATGEAEMMGAMVEAVAAGLSAAAKEAER